ncbi:peptidoglycan-binding domain-containing protein [Gemmobacter serpentinus]|uniref:peptidoglycan-binding domain-containing protein n=1 Tax=Gemmobacter serpentinus TaxID=2652247 RepID=UPI00124EB07A|nr:peptidoglycan-binding domain-containing protein [Gemmobacter serpentinus]
MIARLATGVAVLILLAACTQDRVARPSTADLSKGVIRVRGSDTAAPASEPGRCWTTDTTPAIIETVSEQVIDAPAVTDAQGNVTSPARYATSTHQRILRDRQSIHIRTPCPEDMTVEFIASVQRALKARGFYAAPVTGAMDAPTLAAVRRFQADQGLDSPVLSLAGAKTLGLVKTELDEL